MNPQLKSLISELIEQGIKDSKVLKAMEKIDRKDFLLEKQKNQAYLNIPLSTFNNQTISQPFTVAFMLQELELKESDIVFEIGTGSGWNAALLATICKKGFIYSTEIDKELAKFAKDNLAGYNIKNIKIIAENGLKAIQELKKKFDASGEQKPLVFDKIIITAACPEIPLSLLNYLKQEGILIAPVGIGTQKMIKIKKEQNKIIRQELGDFVFVPLREK